MKILISILILLFSNIVWAKPGDTYHCQKEYGQYIQPINSITNKFFSKDWGPKDFHFKWLLENKIKFERKEFNITTLNIHRYIPQQGEIFEANINDGYIYLRYIDGMFTYTQTSDGKIWIIIANCKIIDL